MVLKKEKRILIVKLSSIGDVIHALPVLYELKKDLRQRVSWIVEKRAAAALTLNPALEELYIIDTKKWRRDLKRPSSWMETLKDIGGTVRRIRRKRFDKAIDLQGLLKSGVATMLSGSEITVGFARRWCKEPLNALFTGNGISIPAECRHVVEQNLYAAFQRKIEAPQEAFRIFTSETDRKLVDDFFRKDVPEESRTIAVNACSGWLTKKWPEMKYAGLIDRLAGDERNLFLLIWGPGEREIAVNVRNLCRDHASSKVKLIPETTIKQLYYLLGRCDYFIGGDTGPMHLAAAAGTPCLGLFGPTDPFRNGPYGKNHISIWKKLPCSSCYKKYCEKADECIQSISVESVTGATKKLIDGIERDSSSEDRSGRAIYEG